MAPVTENIYCHCIGSTPQAMQASISGTVNFSVRMTCPPCQQMLTADSKVVVYVQA